MSETRATWLYRQLTGQAREKGEGNLSDAELLRRFLASGDEAAFELLVWRHGALVLGLCRRVLRHEQDAEDAFQATFLILARKAGSIGRREAVAAWLHKVAYHVALRARAAANRRQAHEESGRAADLHAAPAAPTPAPGLYSELDEEINRLPERYRRPFVLCHLCARSPEEAARELNLTVATLYARLSRARRRLRERLERRGLAPWAGGALFPPIELPGVLAGAAARAAVQLAAGAAPAASAQTLSLMKGVLRTMMMNRLKWTAAMLAILLFVAAGVTVPLLAAREHPVNARLARNDEEKKEEPKKEEPKKEEPLKLTVTAPKDELSLDDANSGKVVLTVKLENVGKEDVIIWPYLTANLYDADGKDVKRTRNIGRWGVGPPGGGSILESIGFITLKPGESHRFRVTLRDYLYDPGAIVGWKLPVEGEYKFVFNYQYNRAKVKKDLGRKAKDIDNEKALWNLAYETEQTVEAKFKVK